MTTDSLISGLTRSVKLGVLLLATSFALMVPPSAHADMTGARQQAFTLSGQLMSPFCPGLLLSSCQSQGAHDLKAEITRRLEAGETQEVIVADLVRRFGPNIRGAPEMRGVGLIAWLGPAVIGGVGVLILGVALRRFARPGPDAEAGTPTQAESSPELSARVDEELDALD